MLLEGSHGVLLGCVVHHLVIGPLCELGVCRVVKGHIGHVLRGQCAWWRMGKVHRVRLLRVLVELGVERLRGR